MHKIKKYQWPSTGITSTNKLFTPDYVDPYTKYLNDQLKKSSELAQAVLPNPFTVSKTPKTSTDIFKSTQLLNKWTGSGKVPENSGIIPSINTTSLKTSAFEFAPQAAEMGLQALGVQKAEVMSGGEQLFSKGADVAFKMGMKSGNPIAMATAAALKGIDLLNQFGGKSSTKQGTIGLNTGDYGFQTSTLAGKKFTLFGNSKRKKVNRLTNRLDTENLLAGDVTYQANLENLAGMNSAGDITQRNLNTLYGGIDSRVLTAKTGAKLDFNKLKVTAEKIFTKKSKDIQAFKEGGKMNIIPDGALHARKHNLPSDIADSVTNKGIPVISYDEGGEITQHAEIEINEIIFTKEVTVKLEELFKKYNDTDSQKEKDKIAIECGKFLVEEILENTDDRTGLIEEVE